MNLLERESRDCFKSQLLQKILTDEYGFVYRESVNRETKLLDGKESDF